MRTFFALSMSLIIASSSYASQPTPCPPDFTDTGAHCTKPPVYGRGPGDITAIACEKNTAKTCEKCLSLYYPVCGESYKPVGCNLCSPMCPAGMTDIGLSCQK